MYYLNVSEWLNKVEDVCWALLLQQNYWRKDVSAWSNLLFFIEKVTKNPKKQQQSESEL